MPAPADPAYCPLHPIDRVRHQILEGTDADALVHAFREGVWKFFLEHARTMPWRENPAPYPVLVSEIMLQQTRVSRVMSFFPRFTDRFPDMSSLAEASFSEVMAAWKGLGYNRRAHALHRIAQLVMEQYGGILPASPQVLATFPQIGHATSCSIAAFAYNKPVVFIETNIRRVFLHTFFPERLKVHDREILPLVELTLPCEDSRRWYYALMDIGSCLAGTGPNPNRQSAHYSRQKAFEGSDRQIRGLVLSYLLDHSQADFHDLTTALQQSPGQVRRVLLSLVKDRLVMEKAGTFYL